MNEELVELNKKLAELEALRLKLYGQQAVDEYNESLKKSIGDVKMSSKKMEKLTEKQKKHLDMAKLFFILTFVLVSFAPIFIVCNLVFSYKAKKIAELTNQNVKQSKRAWRNAITSVIVVVVIVCMVIYMMNSNSVSWFNRF